MESRFRFDGWLSTSTLLAFRAKLFSHLFWNIRLQFSWLNVPHSLRIYALG